MEFSVNKRRARTGRTVGGRYAGANRGAGEDRRGNWGAEGGGDGDAERADEDARRSPVEAAENFFRDSKKCIKSEGCGINSSR